MSIAQKAPKFIKNPEPQANHFFNQCVEVSTVLWC